MEAREFLVPNPLLYSDLGKYIWISDSFVEYRKAQALFTYLIRKGIYINGFATDTKSLVGLKMYNKEIYHRTVLNSETTVIFYDMWFDFSESDHTDKGQLARIINPDFKDGEIVIWGSGITGENAYKILVHYGFHIKFFVDSNKKLAGTTKCSLMVYDPDRLNEIKEEIVVIEALEKWKSLDDSIKEKYAKRFYHRLYSVRRDITCCIDDVERKIFSLAEYWVFHRFLHKKVYIYGNGGIEREFARYLKLMDYNFSGFLIDENDIESDKYNDEFVTKYVEDIIYENDYYIWADKKEKAERLKELGLRYFSEYECNGYIWDISIGKEQLDVNLGHNYIAKGQYPGIMVYGKEKEQDYKIAVLGSSTTDGAMYPFKSWAELLYDELGKNVTVYNGGVRGYSSGQELIKLVRDIVPLRPDMIIVYDGASELFSKTRYPFAFEYSRKVFEYANAHIENNYIVDNTRDICLGVRNGDDCFGNWLSNMQSMYAIAKQRNMEFFVFCQPWLISKNGKTVKEKNILLSMPGVVLETMMKNSLRTYVRERTDIPDYIHDLSHIFDGHDVYMDLCHVWEEGNRIIAGEIKKVIQPVMRE